MKGTPLGIGQVTAAVAGAVQEAGPVGPRGTAAAEE